MSNLKEKWVKALRSGKYSQTTGKLRKPDGFCCLGVLCDISGKGEWEDRTDYFSFRGYGAHVSNLTPIELAAEIGLTSYKEDELTSMNDRGKSFDEIADWIEYNV